MISRSGVSITASMGTVPGAANRPARPEGADMSGEADQAQGRIKQAAGDLTDNDDLKNEGKADEAAGKVKDAIGDAKDRASDAVDAVKDKLS